MRDIICVGKMAKILVLLAETMGNNGNGKGRQVFVFQASLSILCQRYLPPFHSISIAWNKEKVNTETLNEKKKSHQKIKLQLNKSHTHCIFIVIYLFPCYLLNYSQLSMRSIRLHVFNVLS